MDIAKKLDQIGLKKARSLNSEEQEIVINNVELFLLLIFIAIVFVMSVVTAVIFTISASLSSSTEDSVCGSNAPCRQMFSKTKKRLKAGVIISWVASAMLAATIGIMVVIRSKQKQGEDS